MMLERRKAIATLMANRPKDLFVVPGLGSCTYDMASLGEKDSDFYLWGAMGGAAMIGLGLALAQAEAQGRGDHRRRRDADGHGRARHHRRAAAANLAVVVFDNRRYGETGMQASHTEHGVDLVGVARACGIARTFDVHDQAGLETLSGELAALKETLFARVRIAADDPPRVLPSKDGVELKLRFRRAVAARGRLIPSCRASRHLRLVFARKSVDARHKAGMTFARFRLSGQAETEPL